MDTVTTTTFEVSDVELATEPLPEVSYKEAVAAQITPAKPRPFRKSGDGKWRLGQPDDLPNSPASRLVESCSKYHGRLLDRVAYHPVVKAIHLAFMEHRPLRLSPDMIWLMVIQGVANHVNAHSEELRPRIVSHQGKAAIHVRRDDFIKGSPENPWSEVLDEFSTQIREHVGPKIDVFVPAFSTTGLVERAACEIVLLDAMQSYFEYQVFSGCGIPSITLEGTCEDWKVLARRVEGFRELGLGFWLDILSPILGQFARAAQGDVDPTFWRSLYKFNSVSGGAKINGWITAFFPYANDHATKRPSVPHRVHFGNDKELLNSMLYPGDQSDWDTPGFGIPSFPSGLSKAPFRWNSMDRSFGMEFLGGFVGVAQDLETLTLRPEIGWAVREASATE